MIVLIKNILIYINVEIYMFEFKKVGGRILVFNKKFTLFLIIFTTLFFLLLTEGFIVSADSQKLVPGVEYEDHRFHLNGVPQASRILTIDSSDPYLEFQVGIDWPSFSLKRTTEFASENTRQGNRVVGAINGSFYHLNTRLPSYLVSKNNNIYNLGAVSPSENGYMHTPAAFGVSQEGTTMIDTYDLENKFHADGKTIDIKSINTSRGSNEVILFTPGRLFGSTRTNDYGVEIIVRKTDRQIDHNMAFGDEVTGVVEIIKPYGSTNNSAIPKDGFVISGHGTEYRQLASEISVGDEVSVTLDIEDKWKNPSMMVASGPLLVQNGQKELTINPLSSNATAQHPRTAVGIKDDGTVFFVTVDGRQTGYSQGMNLTELANYMVDLGADRAINLDGGGSTTMAINRPGTTNFSVVNYPSDLFERSVSNSLQVVSTAPIGEANSIHFEENNIAMMIDSELAIEPTYIIDENNNLIDYQLSDLIISSGSDLLEVDGNIVRAVKGGKTTLQIEYENAKTEIELTVIDASLYSIDDMSSEDQWSVSNIRATSSRQTTVNSNPHFNVDRVMEFSYDLSVGDPGIAAAYLNATEPIDIIGTPEKIGVWVYGNGNNHWLRSSFIDANGNREVIDLTEEGELNWYGWKYISADLPTSNEKLSFERIYVAERDVSNQNAGKLLFHSLQLHYQSDIEIPYFDYEQKDFQTVDNMKNWTVVFNTDLDRETVNNRTVYVEDLYGKRQSIEVEIHENSKDVIRIKPPNEGFQDNQYYRLVITEAVHAENTKPMKLDFEKIFKVQ
jgi:uncharacterized protein YigE (DUF2233 family)